MKAAIAKSNFQVDSATLFAANVTAGLPVPARKADPIMSFFMGENWRSRVEPVACAIVKLAACAYFALFYTIKHPTFFALSEYAAGRIRLPYQSRALIGWIMHCGARIEVVQAIARHMPGPPDLKNPYELMFLAISFVGILGAVYATQASLTALTSDKRFSRWACLIVLYMATFNLSLSYGLDFTLPYDVPSLFFFCLCACLVLKRKLILYYAVFVLATFNRETSCFIAFFFLICEWFAATNAMPLRRWLKLASHAVLQAMIWIAIKSYLTILFRSNPVEMNTNGVFVFNVAKNLRFLLNPGEWPQLLSIFGFTLPLLVLGFRWIRDRRVQTACLIMIPLWFLSMMIVGVIIEVRIFDELSAILSLALALIIYNWAEDHGLRWQASSEGNV